MLTRLKVTGFKNLIDVDVHFGPFTCVAGANDVGKSNLFDAIKFLSALADHTLTDAASSVRGEGGRTTDIRSLFHRVGDQYADEMSFAVEMIVPFKGRDDLGQPAQASITFLKYTLEIAYRMDENPGASGPLEILREELVQINRNDAVKHLPFRHTRAWRQSVVLGRRTSELISTEVKDSGRIIKLHQDRRPGRPLLRSAASLPRTVLSASNAAESPTALLARREMQSWRLLQLEPSALRQPDDFNAPTDLGVEGSHLPATLFHLGQTNGQGNGHSAAGSAQVYSQIGNRLAELIDDVSEVWIDRDQKRELLTLMVTDRNRTPHPAKALSDGTLRFLALAVLELDPNAQGLLCLEEPENGIHPERIPAMLRLLQDIATDPNEPAGPDNPLRQVIINTHSPAVVGQVNDDSLLVAELREAIVKSQLCRKVSFGCLPETWRAGISELPDLVARGKLLAYLNPIAPANGSDTNGSSSTLPGRSTSGRRSRRVADRPDLQLLLPAMEPVE